MSYWGLYPVLFFSLLSMLCDLWCYVTVCIISCGVMSQSVLYSVCYQCCVVWGKMPQSVLYLVLFLFAIHAVWSWIISLIWCFILSCSSVLSILCDLRSYAIVSVEPDLSCFALFSMLCNLG